MISFLIGVRGKWKKDEKKAEAGEGLAPVAGGEVPLAGVPEISKIVAVTSDAPANASDAAPETSATPADASATLTEGSQAAFEASNALSEVSETVFEVSDAPSETLATLPEASGGRPAPWTSTHPKTKKPDKTKTAANRLLIAISQI